MTPLACTLSELSPSLQARTLREHTVFGLAWYLSSPPDSHRHPLDLAFLLGLGNKVKWYGIAANPGSSHAHQAATQEVARSVFVLASYHWQAGLDSFCPRTVQSRLDRIQVHEQLGLLERVATRLMHKLPILNQRLDSQGVLMKEQGASSLSPEIYKRLEGHLADLEQALLAKDPMMPQHLLYISIKSLNPFRMVCR